MQLMTFNSLLMFDIVFVFFLFLVGVTCLVYYLPTGKQHPSSAVHCKHTRQHYYHPNHHSHHHHHHLHQHQQQHQQQLEHQHKQQKQQQQQDLQNHRYQNRHYQEQQQDQIEDDDSQHQLPQQQCCRNSHEHQQVVFNKATQKITCHHTCQCDDISDCSGHYCSRSFLSLDSIESSPERRVPMQKHHPRHKSQSQHQLHHTHYQQQENQQQIKLKLHKQSDHCFVDDSDDNDDLIYDSGGGRYNALGATFTEHFVVVNETERILPPPPHCCYVKAKLADIKECAGPIDDV